MQEQTPLGKGKAEKVEDKEWKTQVAGREKLTEKRENTFSWFWLEGWEKDKTKAKRERGEYSELSTANMEVRAILS